MKIQIPYKCKKYTPNDNLNKTCDNKARCKIYYDEMCEEYKEKENIQCISKDLRVKIRKENYCNGIDCAWCSVIDCKELKNGKII